MIAVGDEKRLRTAAGTPIVEARHAWWQWSFATRVLLGAPRLREVTRDEDEVEREGINTRIQGAAGDIENESLIDLYEECLRHDDWKLVATVHDSNVIECPIADVEACAHAMKCIMEKPRHLWKREVIFPADVSVSTKSWGELKDYEEWIKEQRSPKAKSRKRRARSARS